MRSVTSHQAALSILVSAMAMIEKELKNFCRIINITCSRLKSNGTYAFFN
jgi:hypothetical protein